LPFSRHVGQYSLSRARAHTRVCLVAEATGAPREREEYAPPEPERTSAETIAVLTRAMRRREAEPLAHQQVEGPDLPATARSALSHTPLAEIAEAGADRATTVLAARMNPTIRTPGRSNDPTLRQPAARLRSRSGARALRRARNLRRLEHDPGQRRARS
jgi:hypothetical protein